MAQVRGTPGIIVALFALFYQPAVLWVFLAMFVAVVVIGVPSVFGGGLRERELRRLRRAAAKHR